MMRAAIAAMLVIACGGDDPAGPPPGAATRVLFIGNSLTYGNDLPAMVRAVAESAGTPMATEMVAMGGVSLEDHWTFGSARSAVAAGRWDVVVLQQGPSGLPSSRAHLREWTLRWAEAIRAAGAQPALYMPWPDAGRMSAYDSVARSYREAASAAGAMLVPGSEAWQAAWRRDPELALYGPDGFHPTPLGTYVVAVAAWARLSGRAAAGAPSGITPDGAPALVLTPPQAAAVREAVAESLGQR